MPSSFNHFGVVGAGAWGTALALALSRAGRTVTLWAFEPDLAESMTKTRENSAYLPGVKLPDSLRITSQMSDLSDCKALVLACPAQHLRGTCRALLPFLSKPIPVILASKGIEMVSYRLMSEIAAAEIPSFPIYILSGPSFAAEVARAMPTALTLASENETEDLALAISSPLFRIYTTDDIIGAQIGGAVKNVLAIACGVVVGRGLGDNARAALITRGLAEIVRLAVGLGARPETMMGLSGLGDIVLTCSSLQSRNMSLGHALGQGRKLNEILAERSSVTEGISTASAALGLARKRGIDMPVVSAVDLILRDKATIESSIESLLARPLRNETM